MNGHTIVRLSEISSTQTYAKQLKQAGQSTIVIAKRQTDGRGTKERSFSSDEGGLYFSKLTFYKDFETKNSFRLMQRTAVAVCKTLESYGFTPKIKWANDVFINGKKVCGILTENTFSGARLVCSLIGVGLNVNNRLPSELSAIATSMQAERGAPFDLSEVESRLFTFMEEDTAFQDYRARLGWLGEEVALKKGNECIPATLLSVNERGELVVKVGEEIRQIAVGEISVRVYGEKNGKER